MRINVNTSAVNTHRIMTQNSQRQDQNLERLASGLKINRGADGPAQLQVSERLRAQSAGLGQAIDNSQNAISVLQTAEAALDEVSRALVNARQLAVHAANEGANDEFMLEADEFEFRNIVDQVNRIAANTQYGKNYLLDGSRAGNGVTTGANLEFVDATEEATSSGLGGYNVTIQTASKRAEHSGSAQLTQAVIDSEEQITISEGGRTVNFRTIKGANVEQNLNELDLAIKAAGLDLELVRPEAKGTDGNASQNIVLRHKQYGSEHTFQVASNTPGLLSAQADVPTMVENGIDVAGEIAGEESTGRGQVLTGGPGAGVAEGIRVRYTGEAVPPGGGGPEGSFAGTVTFKQNSMNFQVGANPDQQVGMSFKSMKSAQLGTGVLNESGFKSFEEASLMDADKAQDAMRVIDRAIEEVAIQRGEMGAFQKNTLESNLNWLRIAHENVQSSESVLRDADMAKEMAEFTRNQILMDASTSMLAHANQKTMSVLKLLG